jgi:hypothetical protein
MLWVWQCLVVRLHIQTWNVQKLPGSSCSSVGMASGSFRFMTNSRGLDIMYRDPTQSLFKVRKVLTLTLTAVGLLQQSIPFFQKRALQLSFYLRKFSIYRLSGFPVPISTMPLGRCDSTGTILYICTCCVF